jgi:hypothetical protein
MKWLLLMCCLLFALPTLAGDAKPIPLRQPPSNVQIINGKRFYSLTNVRRFTGSLDSPKALSVMHHPRTPGVVTFRNHVPPSAAVAAAPAGSSGTGTATPGNSSDQILSVFAPDDKHTPPSPTR